MSTDDTVALAPRSALGHTVHRVDRTRHPNAETRPGGAGGQHTSTHDDTSHPPLWATSGAHVRRTCAHASKPPHPCKMHTRLPCCPRRSRRLGSNTPHHTTTENVHHTRCTGVPTSVCGGEADHIYVHTMWIRGATVCHICCMRIGPCLPSLGPLPHRYARNLPAPRPRPHRPPGVACAEQSDRNDSCADLLAAARWAAPSGLSGGVGTDIAYMPQCWRRSELAQASTVGRQRMRPR